MKRLFWLFAVLACAAFWAAVVHAWATWRFARYEVELSECRGEALAAGEHVQQLLSAGRFVRKYDAKTGASVYVFATTKKEVHR